MKLIDMNSCIEFVINLKNTRNVSISEAYALATEEFVSLRGRHQLATSAAEIEARHYGAEFKHDVFVRVVLFILFLFFLN